jgi:uncharacterized protein (TIGR03032 family)
VVEGDGEQTAPEAPEDDPSGWREARYRYSASFPDVLRQLGCGLLISTYQAGKLVSVGVGQEGLTFSFHSFDQAMGVAVGEKRLAVGARGQVWYLRDNPDIAAQLPPQGRFDRCFLPRSTVVTGGIHCHEVVFGRPAQEGGEPETWVVNTLFSCLATLHPDFNFVPRWRPPFVSELAIGDRCHLNGLAMRDGLPAYVTLMAQTDEPGAWRENKNETGTVLDVETGEAVTTGLAMPHSPRWHRGRLYVLNSGNGALEAVHLDSGGRTLVAKVPGYARGLACHGDIAFVGLSRIRETNVFGGVPIAENHEELKCGVGVVDLRTGITLATLEFESGVEEIFDVQLLPNTRAAAVGGEAPPAEEGAPPGAAGEHEVWVVPPESSAPSWIPPRRPTGPTDADVQAWIGSALQAQRAGQGGQALRLFRQAAMARPESAEILNHLGNALQDSGDQIEALRAYRRAAALDPAFVPALQNLGYLLVNRGATDEGADWLRKAQEREPTPINRALIATALPVVYTSANDLAERRERLEGEVASMVADGVEVDTGGSLIPTSFFTAYQGRNDRPLNEQLGQVYKGYDATGGRSVSTIRRRPKVGFLSAYFRDHTIGRLNIGRLERVSEERFETVVLSVGQHNDALAARFAEAGEHFVALPRDVPAARKLIAEQELDLLFFADVGMDALTYTLCFSRMAPVQAVTWGHPVTTGSPHMDLFLSSELLEIPEADEHYTERLVRPPTLCTYYERPELQPGVADRGAFGLTEGANLYVCPQTLFKFHPDFDGMLAGILRDDPKAEIALIKGRAQEWTDQLTERLRMTVDDPARIKWLDPVPRARFLDLLAISNVVLDTPHFGGGNTSYEALALGKPLVTLPSDLLRGRITQALYAKAGYTDLVADSPERFVEIAVELGTDQDHRVAASEAIAESCDVLFEDDGEVRDFEQFLSGSLS